MRRPWMQGRAMVIFALLIGLALVVVDFRDFGVRRKVRSVGG
jgi:hypothetical protein